MLPTLIDVAGGSYPTNFDGKQHPPLPGRSFASMLTKGETLPPRILHFALFNNLALIHDGWKIATAYSQPWQLYDLKNDRTETRDLAAEQPEKLAELLALQKAFNKRPDVRLRLQSGEREPEYAPPFKPDGTRGPGASEDVADETYALLLITARAEGRQLTEAEMAKLKQQAAGKSDSADAPATNKKRKAK